MTIRAIGFKRLVGMVAALGGVASCSAGNETSNYASTSEPIRNGSVVTPWGPNPAPAESKAIVSVPGCTGTIVQPSWVLTAKHCLTQVGAPIVSKRPTGDITRIVDVAVPNPDPDRDTLMLHLSSPFPSIPQVPLYSGTTASIVGHTVSCYGYGYKTMGNACTSTSQCAAGQVCDRGACMTGSTELRTANMVASTYFTDSFANPDIFGTPANSAGQTILPGDSGGPCFLNGALAGVNSFGGGGFTGDQIGYQTSVPASLDWAMAPSRIMYTPGDFNGDGKKDVIITNVSGSYWYYSNGDGTFSVPYQRADLPLGKVMFTPADFNGDGKTDLIITTPGGSYWYYSTGFGTWNQGYERTDWPFHSVAYVTADFNGDGKADFVETDPTGSFFYYSTGTGTWNQAYTRIDLKMGVVSYAPGDYNGDGKKDLIITTPAGSFWMYSTGTGTFNQFFSRSDLPLQNVSFVPGDYNGDGRTDFIILTAGGSYWYYPTASGTWDVPFQRTDMPLGTVAYVPADFNGDGKSDMIIVNASGSYWYYSTGTGTWNAAFTRTDLTRYNVSYTAADLSGDGKSDVIISNVSGSYGYYSSGTGTFTNPWSRTDLPM